MNTPQFRPLTLPWRRTALVLWGISITVIVVLSLHPRWGPPGGMHLDKLFHTLGYFTVAALPFLAFTTRGRAWRAMVLMLPLGIGLEFLQGYVPGRSSDVMDMVANTAGVIMGGFSGPWCLKVADSLIQQINPGAKKEP
jgi:VanZ family protein